MDKVEYVPRVWEGTLLKTQDRNMKMLHEFVDCDIAIKIQNWSQFVHKYVLSLNSSKLSAIMSLEQYNDCSKDKPSDLTELVPVIVEVEAIKAFIEFLYLGEIRITITLHNLTDVIYISRKFGVLHFVEYCTFNVNNWVSQPAQFWELFRIMESSSYSTPEVEIMIKNLYIGNEEKWMNSSEWLDFSHSQFSNFLTKNILNIPAKECFLIAMKWAEHQCRSSNLEISTKNKRDFLQDLLSKVEYSSMTSDELLEVLQSGLFTEEEKVSLFHLLLNTAMEESGNRYEPIKFWRDTSKP